jgi:hypothetical protein
MTFTGIDNQTVDFRITNYQYPDTIDGGWDSNWLIIFLNVKSKIGNWQAIDPSLTTWEVQELINWFYKLSKSDHTECLNMSFTEPNLSFELLDIQNKSQKKFRIKFALESRPKSAREGKDYFVDCVVDDNELSRLCEDLRAELDKFPERKFESKINKT